MITLFATKTFKNYWWIVKKINECSWKWINDCQQKRWWLKKYHTKNHHSINAGNNENETTHTSAENPILNISTSENLVNSYCKQIIFIQGETVKFLTSIPFLTKTRITANLSNNVEEETLLILRNFIVFISNKQPLYLSSDSHYHPTTDLLQQITPTN